MTNLPPPPENTAGSSLHAKPRRRWIVPIVVVLGTLLVGLGALKALGVFYVIPSPSMGPSYPAGCRVWASNAGTPSRGQAVMLERLPNETTLRRVVAIGGDTVSVERGVLQINGEPADEPYLEPGTSTESLETTEVPAGQLFVLGDQRRVSLDSRTYGPIPEGSVTGIVRFGWWGC